VIQVLRRWQRRAPTLTALALLLLVWEVVAQLEISFAFPSLGEVWKSVWLVSREADFRASVGSSLRDLGVGLGLAFATGIPIGLAMGLWRPVEDALDVYVNALMGAPTAAFVPILVAIFGVGGGAIVATVYIFSVFFLIVNTYAGVRGVDRRLLEMASSFQASWRKTITRVVLPNAMPLMLTGVRLAFGRAVAGLILGQMLVVVVGLGGLIMQAGSSFQISRLWALIFMVVVFAVVITRVIEHVEKRTTSWASSQTRL
jgi:NitT/TauT family transport system permease protein